MPVSCSNTRIGFNHDRQPPRPILMMQAMPTDTLMRSSFWTLGENLTSQTDWGVIQNGCAKKGRAQISLRPHPFDPRISKSFPIVATPCPSWRASLCGPVWFSLHPWTGMACHLHPSLFSFAVVINCSDVLVHFKRHLHWLHTATSHGRPFETASHSCSRKRNTCTHWFELRYANTLILPDEPKKPSFCSTEEVFL